MEIDPVLILPPVSSILLNYVGLFTRSCVVRQADK